MKKPKNLPHLDSSFLANNQLPTNEQPTAPINRNQVNSNQENFDNLYDNADQQDCELLSTTTSSEENLAAVLTTTTPITWDSHTSSSVIIEFMDFIRDSNVGNIAPPNTPTNQTLSFNTSSFSQITQFLPITGTSYDLNNDQTYMI